MKRLFLLLITAAVTLSAAGSEFKTLVNEVSNRYQIRPVHIPLMGFASFCTRVASGGGVRNLHVAAFDELTAPIDLADLTSVLRTSLGAAWQTIISETSRGGGDQTIIFVRPAGNAMRMVIADYEHSELDIVALELNGEALAKWMDKPGDPR